MTGQNPFRKVSTVLRRLVTVAIAATACAALTLPAYATTAVSHPITHSADGAAISLTPIGTHTSDSKGESAAEIVAWYAKNQRLFVVNAADAKVDVLQTHESGDPTFRYDIVTTGVQSEDGSEITAEAVANSVAVRPDGLGVIAVEAPNKTDNGWVVFFDANADKATILGAVRVGALPDMVTFTPDGKQILVANEGEPAEDYSVDPEGSISVIKAPPKIRAGKQNQVKTADFRAFEGKLPDGVRIFGPDGTDAQNLEPEYITVDSRSKKAYVSLQENNAIAVVNLDQARVERIFALGTQDRSEVATGMRTPRKRGSRTSRCASLRPPSITPLTPSWVASRSPRAPG